MRAHCWRPGMERAPIISRDISVATHNSQIAEPISPLPWGDSLTTGVCRGYKVWAHSFTKTILAEKSKFGGIVWTSNLQRTVSTAAFITSAVSKRKWECLQE